MNLREATLDFINSNHITSQGVGVYKYSQSVSLPTLYSSCYAAKTRSLYSDLDTLSCDEKKQWASYLNSFQDDDGLFRDPLIYNHGWYMGDPLWCGRPHLTCHVINALTCLGAVADKPMSFLDRYICPDSLVEWLKSRNWVDEIAYCGNEIMNIGTLLQYVRDFQGNDKAGNAVAVMLEWLCENHINPDNGVWGCFDLTDPVNRSNAVMAAYHWWPLFFYDDYPVPYMDRAIDTIIDTQNPNGGFGWGIHNPEEPFISSACEDIDSIDPLARLMQKTNYRRDDIILTLEKAVDWVLKNHMPDGGFVFMLDRPFEYGHPQLNGDKNTGAMFPTWFRTLALAILGKVLPLSPVGSYPWNFIRCPGFQFW